MLISQLISKTLREDPVEAETASHRLLLKSGMIYQVASGIYAFLPLAYRSIRKIEQLIREEMDSTGAQELFMPTLQPEELWEQTNRRSAFGDNLFSLSLESKRNDFEMVMLVGFASVGQAVSHQKSLNLVNAYLPKTIMVQVNVPESKGETMIFEASCPAEKAIALVEGRMDSSEFMQQLNMETL